MADPERGGGLNELQRGTPFLKRSRISLAYCIISKQDQSFIKKVTLFSCYIEEYVDFVPFSGTWGDGYAWPP